MSRPHGPANEAERARFGPYELLMELAAGGMAKVHLAKRTGAAGFARVVVVKRVHRHLARSTEFRDMFREEARIAASIHHPNVVSVVDVVEERGELFLVLEYVDSTPLSSLLRTLSVEQRLFEPSVASRIVLDALAGLEATHDATDLYGAPLAIVHRDVSPQNVIVGVDGVARLIDFGIARAERRTCATHAGQLKGKSAFMSPEQARGEPLDRRSDLFSLGIVLHEALTAERLFAAEHRFESIRRIVDGAIPLPSERRPDVSPALDAVVSKALERDRDRRFACARELAEALEAACPPAPHREVARAVEHLAGAALRTRRAALHELLAAPPRRSTSAVPAGDRGVALAPPPNAHAVEESRRPACLPTSSPRDHRPNRSHVPARDPARRAHHVGAADAPRRDGGGRAARPHGARRRRDRPGREDRPAAEDAYDGPLDLEAFVHPPRPLRPPQETLPAVAVAVAAPTPSRSRASTRAPPSSLQTPPHPPPGHPPHAVALRRAELGASKGRETKR